VEEAEVLVVAGPGEAVASPRAVVASTRRGEHPRVLTAGAHRGCSPRVLTLRSLTRGPASTIGLY
jgi:hypothetical protein